MNFDWLFLEETLPRTEHKVFWCGDPAPNTAVSIYVLYY